MKKLIILAFMAFSVLAMGQEVKNYNLTQVQTNKGGTWGAIPSSNGQLIFVDNAANVSKGDDFKSRLFVLDRNNKETALPNFSEFDRIGSPFISADGNELFFTISGTVSYTKGGGIFSSGTKVYPLQIMMSKKEANGNWGVAEPFVHNGNTFSTGDPCLSPDGAYLYFSSDRDGGQGGTDIWRSKRNGSNWDAPENIGGTINSTGDDRFPRFDTNGNLYFSSTRGSETGVLDLFKCTGLNSPVRMDYPFNAEGDDFAIAFVTDETGYLSSSRTGADRIYYFEPVKPVVVRDTIKIIETKPIEIDPRIDFAKLKPIYFDFDKSVLRFNTEMSKLLDLVVFMRQYPTTVINMPSHADCRGNDPYNMRLSQRRGEAVKKYLVETGGIDADRIQVTERGANNPVTDCDCNAKTRCKESEFQANRRVEYELVKY